MSDGWITVKAIAKALGKSTRTVQLKIKKDMNIKSRMKDGRSLEIYIGSLPSDWQMKIRATSPVVVANRSAVTAMVPSAKTLDASDAPATVANIGAALTDAQRKRLMISAMIKDCPPTLTKTQWIAKVARINGVSISTVRRIENEVAVHGTVQVIRKSGRNTKWDAAAIEYLKSFYLQAMSEIGTCSKSAAWKACQKEAEKKGWSIGSRSSAYTILDDIHHLLVEKAMGGRRALDNYFYIARDLSLLAPFQVVVGDQHIFDYWVADYNTGRIWRPECYLWLDMKTRLIYGIAFAENHYNATTVRDALRFGLYRFGRPDCTYNDNGSSECSKAITSMVDDLLRDGINTKDVTDLYRAPDGTYVIADEDENKVIDLASSAEEWKAKHRRIYANVKNAKTKPIERFFRTLESMLDDKMLPGRCATPGAAAAVDEVERARLEKQKEKCELLSFEQFMTVVVQVLAEYEETKHSTLKMSPRHRLEIDEAEGFKLKKYEPKELYRIELITADRKKAKIQRGRVLVNGIWYQGEELSASGSDLLDTGLWSHDGEYVEVRYSKYTGLCYAIVKGEARKLEPVKKIEMLDEVSMVEAMCDKNRQIRAVTEVFNAITKSIGSVKYTATEDETSQDQAPISPEKESTEEKEFRKALPFLPLHHTSWERYQWCLDIIIAGCPLSEKDKNWARNYRESSEYEEYLEFWTNYELRIKEEIL
nr:transposase domain-containing protein [uncultured Sphaerochaeta sp.]